MLDLAKTDTSPSGPPRPSTILWPGIRSLPKGVERYLVEAGGSVVVAVEPGDEIAVVDVEGGQACELVAADAGGKVDTTATLGAAADSEADGVKEILAGDGFSAGRTRAALKRRNIDLGTAKAIRVFGTSSRPGDRADFVAVQAGTLIVAAPGGVMDFDRQNTVTPVELFVKRAVLRLTPEAQLPDPLADPLQDIRIGARTAQAYTVKAGEYVQIIDVSGRQCTDFQAFSIPKLEAGRELALDATITRALLGLANPIPGIPAKAFDLEMDPLIETIQDTCGRHDAFLTACNSRYYDDMGYPGHVNCTDNFNAVLGPHGIAHRRGWEALNYFYNTRVDDQNQIYFDEPWSRPGDYILLRAVTDLVCVSSACPCDIDAANGWNPTDIHVRTYSEKELFSKAVAFRMTPDADPQMTKETGFHACFARFTSDFTEYNGYWLANRFNNDGPIEEYWACREKAVVMDLSPLRKFEVTGPDAENLLQYCMTRNIRKLSPGQVVYTAMCYEHGGMIDDGTVYRLDQDNFRWVGGNDVSGLWMREQADKLGLKAWVRSSTDQMHNIAVQGPHSRDILKKIIWTSPNRTPLEDLEWFRFTVGRIDDFHGVPVVVSRTGYSGELGYEVFCHPRDAETVFDAVWEAGQEYELSPLGLEALDMVRVESGLIFAGYEFSDQTDPFEAGIGFTVPLKSKDEDFIGREALKRRKENPARKLVGLEIASNELVGNGDCIHIGRPQIGEVTSGMRSPKLKKNIALARIDVAHAGLGTEVEIGKLDGHIKRLPAKIVAFPHYDPEKKRPRS
ncbi:MAG: DUF1989 domain-containing protein [Alphaproteobacteria bacterium]|nr:DUF1989 domain-containing protein [Alphaproteobacteria bacterium]